MEFEIKELRRLKYFIGIEIAQSKWDIFIFEQYNFPFKDFHS